VGKYVNKPMEELATELSAGLGRLRRGYVDSAEQLLRTIEPDKEYPYEFVVYRLTKYRPRGKGVRGEMMSGASLRADLMQLVLDVCDSIDLKADDIPEPVYDTPALALRFHVSTKTIQRWRHRGLAARKIIFPDGKRRLGYLESSVRWFVRNRRRQVMRSIHFKQMTAIERNDIIRRAKRMATLTRSCLSDVARRLAKRTGRAVETIRYTIRKHDAENPHEAVFPDQAGPLDEEKKQAIYRSFLRGVPVPALASQYGRTRSSIYRVINETRARGLLERSIDFVYNPQFELPNADDLILVGDVDYINGEQAGKKHVPKPPPDLPPYLRALYRVPLLSPDQEKDLFRRYNYLKFKADKIRLRIDSRRVQTDRLKEVEQLLLRANAVKNQIIRANLRLVVSIAKKHVGGPQTLFELISDGNVSLMRAVEKFDYARGFRFSTYASWAIMRNYARSVPKERYQLDRFATGQDEILDIAASLQSYDPSEMYLPELRESIDAVLAQLAPRERTILISHYGLDETQQARTLEQLSHRLGISKERVRQIEIRALTKLRRILYPQRFELMA